MKLFVCFLSLLFSISVSAQGSGPSGDENSSQQYSTTQVLGDEHSDWVPEGHSGYIIKSPTLVGGFFRLKGGFEGTITGPGYIGWVFLFDKRVIPIDIRPNTYSEYFQIMTKDKLRVSFRVHALLKVQDGGTETIRQLVEEYGAQSWYKTVVQANFRTFVRSEVLKHDAFELNEQGKIELIEKKILDDLSAFIEREKIPIKAQRIAIGNFHFPEGLAQEIENTQIMTQRLSTKKQEIEVASKEGDITVLRAKKAAEAQREQQKSLSSLYVQMESLKVLEKLSQSPNKTIIYIPVGAAGLPIVHPTDVENAVLK